ncbi:MAG: MBL fold metallo-hydrolase [Candidatus Micrarchaeota archaeon]|nr:MBL fold metallo-hydrolase [Candidatus Micrarchaeota archaeon]
MGAGQEVGRSAFLLDTGNVRFLMDYGIKLLPGETKGVEYPLELPSKPHFVVLSHAHLDHCGYLPSLFSKGETPPFLATKPTLEISEVMWKDALKVAKINKNPLPFKPKDIKQAGKYWEEIGRKNSLLGVNMESYDAGHILGSVYTQFEVEGKKILYTGDFKYTPTELHNGAEHPPETDVLLIESTYWYQNHPSRKEQIQRIYDIVDGVIEDGGTVLFPSFALGRTQDLIEILADRYYGKVPVYVDGMGKKITEIYLKYKDQLKDKDFEKKVKKVRFIENRTQRKKATEKPSIIISTSGMLDGGPALEHMLHMSPKSAVILTGYQVEGTNGHRLLTQNKIKIDGYELKVEFPVYYLSLSAHADRGDIFRFIQQTSPEKIILIHSDSSQLFEEELRNDYGYDAKAIKTGESIEL